MLSKEVCKRCVTNRRLRGIIGHLEWYSGDDKSWREGYVSCCQFRGIPSVRGTTTFKQAEKVCDKLFEHAVAAGMKDVV